MNGRSIRYSLSFLTHRKPEAATYDSAGDPNLVECGMISFTYRSRSTAFHDCLFLLSTEHLDGLSVESSNAEHLPIFSFFCLEKRITRSMDYTPPVRIGPKNDQRKKKERNYVRHEGKTDYRKHTTQMGNFHPHRQSPTCHADMIRLSEWRIGLALPESPDAQTEQR